VVLKTLSALEDYTFAAAGSEYDIKFIQYDS